MACRMRCLFSTMAMRTCASPCSPKPMPGDTATLACVSRSLEKASEPSSANALGIGAQANMMADGAGSVPARRGQALDQHVAALLVGVARLDDAVLRAVERRRRGDLDRREGAVVEVRLDAGQRLDQRLVAGGEADAPARHRVGLAHRGELDGDVARARHLQHRRRRIAVEIDLGIGEVAQDPDALAFAEIDDRGIEVEIDRPAPSGSTDSSAPARSAWARYGAPRARAPAGTPRARCCPAPGCGAPSRRR